MASLLLKNASLALPEELVSSDLLISGESIERIGSGLSGDETIDLKGSVVLPGFIDMHNHGAVGIDVNEADSVGLLKVGEFLAECGVTSWLPTFVPDSVEVYSRVVGAMRETVAMQQSECAAQIVGVHYEGIFANTQMCGALRPEFFREFSGTELDDLPELEGSAHLTTFAPEVRGGLELVRKLKVKGWIPSVGHTRADVATLDAAYDAGARHVTHLFNAMSGFHHREIGVAGWALTKEGLTCDIIADGMHVAPQILALALKMKGADALALISDSVAPTGLGDGDFSLWGENIAIKGRTTKNDRGSIAGSVITMADAVRTYRSLGTPWEVIAKIASSNPASILGLEDRGVIAEGKRADLVAMDVEGRVTFVSVGGKVRVKVSR
jgi:N-acetylglucosamine-6-phosphate deacetylase